MPRRRHNPKSYGRRLLAASKRVRKRKPRLDTTTVYKCGWLHYRLSGSVRPTLTIRLPNDKWVDLHTAYPGVEAAHRAAFKLSVELQDSPGLMAELLHEHEHPLVERTV